MTELAVEISGMTCGHCVRAVRDALSAVPGVEVDTVSIGSATLRFDAHVTDVAQITKSIVDEGYAVTAPR